MKGIRGGRSDGGDLNLAAGEAAYLCLVFVVINAPSVGERIIFTCSATFGPTKKVMLPAGAWDAWRYQVQGLVAVRLAKKPITRLFECTR